MSIIGQTISAIIVEESERFYFLQKGEDLLRLDKTEGEHTVGDVVTGFVYVDKDDHRRLTTLEQKATNEHYGWGTVTAVRKDLVPLLTQVYQEKMWSSLLMICHSKKTNGQKLVTNFM